MIEKATYFFGFLELKELRSLFDSHSPYIIRGKIGRMSEKSPKRAVIRRKFLNSRRVEMIKFVPGSHTYSLISLLSVVGEFPTYSLSLIGNRRTLQGLITRLNNVHEVRDNTGKTLTKGRIINIIGKGLKRRIRLDNDALPLVEYLGLKDYYTETILKNRFPSDMSHLERTFRFAEIAAIFMRSNIEFRTQYLPKLQVKESIKRIQKQTIFYQSRLFKAIKLPEYNTLVRNSKIIGMMIAFDEAFLVYNFRSCWLRKMMEGESKILLFVDLLARYNFEVKQTKSAIVFGKSYKVALRTLKSYIPMSSKNIRLDDVYKNIFFIPNTDFGTRLVRFFTIRNWREKILASLFGAKFDSKSIDGTIFHAVEGDIVIFSFLDSNLTGLMCFRDFLINTKRTGGIICYPEQEKLVKEYFGSKIKIKTVSIDRVEEVLKVNKRGLFDEK